MSKTLSEPAIVDEKGLSRQKSEAGLNSARIAKLQRPNSRISFNCNIAGACGLYSVFAYLVKKKRAKKNTTEKESFFLVLMHILEKEHAQTARAYHSSLPIG
jgi:hypothetical protein